MAERLAYLEAVVGADITQFRKGMRDIRNDVGILSETMGGLGKIGRTMTFTLTAPLVALGSMAVQTAGEFDAAMRNINAIAGLPEAQLADLTQRTLEFGSAIRSGPIDSANALYTVFSAGLTETEAAFSTMEVAVKTAEAGLADLETTTEGLVASMLSYGDTSEDFAWRASNALTAMVAVGVGSMEEFAGAVGRVLPTAAALDISIEELYGDMAFLTQRGLSASTAATSLNSALTSMVKPSEAMTAAFQKLGVKGAEELIQQMGGVNGAIQALINTSDGSQKAIQAMFNTKQGARAINQFAKFGDQWVAAMDEFQGSLDGATMRAWEQQMMSFEAQFGLMTSALQALAIAVGSQIIPIITPLIQKFTEFVGTLATANPELIQLGVLFGMAVAAAGPLLWLISSLVTPFTLAAGAVAVLAGAFDNDFAGIATIVNDTINDIIGDIQPLKDIFDEFMSILYPAEEETPVLDFGLGEVNTSKLITVTGPTSAYAIFEEQGYGDLMSWEDFQAALVDQGWEGGAIEVGDNFTIDVQDSNYLFPTLQMVQDVFNENYGKGYGPMEANMQWDFSSRLNEAFARVWPKIQLKLGEIWTNVTTWVDDKAGALLQGIANWFSPGEGTGDTPLYQAVKLLLDGEIWRAIDTIIPGLGTKLQNLIGGDWGAKIGGAFPQISAGLSALFDNFMVWAQTEGVPTLARVAGYLVGTLGAKIGEGLGALGSFLTGGGAEEGAASAGEMIVDPFMSGFNDAMEAQGVEGFADKFVTGIAGALGGFILLKKGLFGGVAYALKSALLLAFNAIKWVAPMFASVAKMAISALVGAIGIVPLALVTATIGLITLIVSPEARQAAADAVGGFIDDLFGEGTTKAGVRGFEDMFYEAFGGALSALGDPRGEDIKNMSEHYQRVMNGGAKAAAKVPIEVATGPIVPNNMDDHVQTMQNVINDLWNSGMVTSQVAGSWDFIIPEPGNVDYSHIRETVIPGLIEALKLSPTDAEKMNVQAFLAALNSQMVDAGETTGYDPLSSVGLPQPGDITAAAEELTPELDTTLAQFANTVAANIGPGGTMDAQAVIDNFLMPMQEAWLLYFGEESPMSLAWSNFYTAFDTGGLTMETRVQTLLVAVQTKLPIMVNAVISNMARMTTALDEANEMLGKVINGMEYLFSLDAEMDIKIELTASGDADLLSGSHAMGLTRVPYDGYVAELHKGERVLTAQEASNYDVGAEMAGDGGRGGNTTTNNQNNVNIYGVEDVDGLINELERRGIYLT